MLLLLGCNVENTLGTKDDDVPAFDTGDSVPFEDKEETAPPPPTEECNGFDDDGDGQIDEDYPDDNGNGRADCLDVECPVLNVGVAGSVTIDELCEGTTGGTSGEVDDPWNVDVKWQVMSPSSYSSNMHSYHSAMIGNLTDDNGDGDVDEDDTPEVVVNAHNGSSGVILALDGATGAEQWAWNGAGLGAGVAIADVDGDGYPDVITADGSGKAVLLDRNGTEVWRATRAPSYSYYNLITVADLEGDGTAEVIVDDLVIEGATGNELFSLSASTSNPYRMVAVADVDLDGDQELFIGGNGYDSDGTLLWSSGETGSYGFWPVVFNADADDEAEIGFVGQQWTLFEHDGTEIYSRSYGQAQPGPPCVGDFDGDGVAEVAWPAYQNLVMYELDGTPVWQVPIDDTSGLAGCSGYDVNGDGPLEILFADQSSFTIFDGSTGREQYVNTNHRSGTLFEYPTVADTDKDGHTEIVFTSNYYGTGGALVTALEHAGDGWPAAGSTWGIHDFAITNIGADNSVPASPDPYWIRYNVYRARVAADDPSTPDLVATITDACVADCDYGPVEVAVQVWNQGGLDVGDGTPLALYANEGSTTRLVATTILPEIAAGEKLAGITFSLSPADVGVFGFRVVVDDDGSGNDDVNECVEDNNDADYTDAWCP